MSSPKVSSSNTKAEILDAFQQLKAQLDEQKARPSAAVSFRAQILSLVEKIESELADRNVSVEQLNHQIDELTEQLQLGERVKFTQEQLEKQREKIAEEEQKWQRQQKQQKEAQKQEEDWRQGRWEKQVEQKKWELSMEERNKTRELEEKEKLFARKAIDYKQLKAQTDSFPEQLRKAEEKAGQRAAQEAQAAFATEKQILVQQYESQKQLLEQKIQNLENWAAEEKNEKKKLEQQLAAASQQIKQLAVTALESKTPKIQPEPQVK